MLVCKTWHHLPSDRLISAAAAFPLMLSTSDTPASLLFANMPGLFPPQTSYWLVSLPVMFSLMPTRLYPKLLSLRLSERVTREAFSNYSIYSSTSPTPSTLSPYPFVFSTFHLFLLNIICLIIVCIPLYPCWN